MAKTSKAATADTAHTNTASLATSATAAFGQAHASGRACFAAHSRVDVALTEKPDAASRLVSTAA